MRIGWCAYFMPFMFVYTPALIMNDGPPAICDLARCRLLGIFMGTVAVVGYCFAPVPWPFRIAYGADRPALLVQPTMFDGAIWVIGVGVSCLRCARDRARSMAASRRAAAASMNSAG